LSIPKTVGDVLAHLGWHQAMLDEISGSSEQWNFETRSFTFLEICCWL